MSDYIERQKAIDAVMETFKRIPTTAIRAMVSIKALPSADVVQVVHGKWTRILLRNEKGGCIGAEMICSECGSPNGHDEKTRFCPNCGAKMDREEET